MPLAYGNILLSMTFLIILGFLQGLKSLVILQFIDFFHAHRNKGKLLEDLSVSIIQYEIASHGKMCEGLIWYNLGYKQMYFPSLIY